MRRGRRQAAVVLALVAMSGAGCVGPARTTQSYRLKAKGTIAAVESAVGTARLVTRLAVRKRAFAPYLSVLAGDAEREATAAQATFDSIQPPNATSDHLRDRVDGLVSDAVDELVQIRIAVRRDQLAAAGKHDRTLAELAKQLERFHEGIQ